MSATVKTTTYDPQVLTMYSYWGKIVKVVDGDTYDILVDAGFDIRFQGRFRLLGVDTPEVFGVKRDTEDYQRGLAASKYARSILPTGKWVEVRVYQSNDKYGRWLADIYVDGASLAEMIIAAGHGVKYVP